MEEQLHTFLRERGIGEDVVHKMNEDKVDAFVIGAADDEVLERYLPHVGDRLAVKKFCNVQDGGERSQTQSRKDSILISLRKKLLMKRGATLENEQPASRAKRARVGNKNARKDTRKIEFGWLTFNVASGMYRQVRKRRGGGTRKVDIQKNANKSDIEHLGMSLFFPHGHSLYGPSSDFVFEILDFTEEKIVTNETVGEMYERTGMNTLRFYIATKRTTPQVADSSEHEHTDVDATETTHVPGSSTEATVTCEENERNTSKRRRFWPNLPCEDISDNEDGSTSSQVSANNDASTSSQVSANKDPLTSRQLSANKDASTSSQVSANKDASTSNQVSANNDPSTSSQVSADKDASTSNKVSTNKDASTSNQVSANNDPSTSSQVSADKDASTSNKVSTNKDASTSNQVSANKDASTSKDAPTSKDTSISQASSTSKDLSNPREFQLAPEDDLFLGIPEHLLDEDEDLEVIFNFKNYSQTNAPDSSPEPHEYQLVIHRGPVAFNELITHFKYPGILHQNISIIRILENGEKEQAADTGGVLRDLLTEFWSEFYSRCTVGRDIKVPSLRHDFGSEEWMAVGRLLSYGYQNVGYWPVSLADSFFRQCIFPECDLSAEKLMENFYSHISITDVDVFQAAVKYFESVEEDDLLESLDAHDCRTKPNAENVKSVLLEIAHKEIIQTPMFVCDCWRDILQKTNITVEKLEHIYSVLIPNNKKVLHMLTFSDNDKQTSEVSKYLKKYVREMDIKALKLFLRFCTGSDLMTEDKITVEFAHMEGLARRPIGHTCGCVLELAYHYDNYMEFRSEFEGVLQSNIWVMDIV